MTCTAFHWNDGASFSCCRACGRPAWEHDFIGFPGPMTPWSKHVIAGWLFHDYIDRHRAMYLLNVETPE